MKRMLLGVAIFSLLVSATAATSTSKKGTKPWYSVPRSDVKITAERSGQMKPEAVVIYGNGVAVWNNSVQIRLDDQRVTRILAAFDAADFEHMPQGEEGERLRRRAGIRAGDYVREVIETWEGEQEREEKHAKDSGLKKLVDAVFTIVTPVAKRGGQPAASLSEGLNEVASGKLAPETLSVVLLIKPEAGGRSERRDGFLLRIEDGFASLSRYTEQGFSAPARIKLSESQAREIASRLLSFDLETFPINLYSTDYTDLTVSVLNRRKNVLARQFTGMTPTKFGERQTRFASLIAWLEETRGTLFPQSSTNQ
jgi:hypothetical protein